MKVQVEPLNAKSWSNIHQYKNCHTDVSTYFLKNGSIHTGLSEEDEERLAKKVRQDLSPSSDYWNTFYIRMTDKAITLDTSDPFDELKYLFLVGSEGVKGHRLVAESLQQMKATAEYVIVNAEAEASEKNKRSKVKRDATIAFSKLSTVDISKALRLYGYKSENISAEQSESKMYDLVEENPQRFLDMWVNNKQRETQFLIESAISKNVMRKNKNAYMYGTEIIGHSIEDTIAFLNDKKNQEIKMVILNEIDSK